VTRRLEFPEPNLAAPPPAAVEARGVLEEFLRELARGVPPMRAGLHRGEAALHRDAAERYLGAAAPHFGVVVSHLAWGLAHVDAGAGEPLVVAVDRRWRAVREAIPPEVRVAVPERRSA
jgi:hypothetical protein